MAPASGWSAPRRPHALPASPVGHDVVVDEGHDVAGGGPQGRGCGRRRGPGTAPRLVAHAAARRHQPAVPRRRGRCRPRAPRRRGGIAARAAPRGSGASSSVRSRVHTSHGDRGPGRRRVGRRPVDRGGVEEGATSSGPSDRPGGPLAWMAKPTTRPSRRETRATPVSSAPSATAGERRSPRRQPVAYGTASRRLSGEPVGTTTARGAGGTTARATTDPAARPRSWRPAAASLAALPAPSRAHGAPEHGGDARRELAGCRPEPAPAGPGQVSAWARLSDVPSPRGQPR